MLDAARETTLVAGAANVTVRFKPSVTVIGPPLVVAVVGVAAGWVAVANASVGAG